jgi:hypothetical protein
MSTGNEGDRLDPRDLVASLYRYDNTRADHRQWILDAQLQRHAAEHLMAANRLAFDRLANIDGMPIEKAAPLLVDLQLHRPALMLAAYSVELMLKALIIKKDPKAAGIETHDLNKLSETAGMQSMLDQDVLRSLKQFAIWKGRYSTSKATKRMLSDLKKQAEHVERVLSSGTPRFGDIRPLPGLELPTALHDHSAKPEDGSGSASIAFFNQAIGIYHIILQEWRK